MKLANPIYDAAFKFLLEDTEVAKELIGHIIGEEITELILKPQELQVKSPKYVVIVLRIDFKATIKTKEGKYKKVLIEIQKGKENKDILRFRRYLGTNYREIDKVKVNSNTIEKQTLPIIPIYFLGFRLANVKTPVVKANRVYTDLVTNLQLNEKEEFIEQLSHDSYFIQIPRLHRKHRNELESILKVFNQSYRWSEDSRLINISKEELAENSTLKKIGERLMRAAADDDLLAKMDMEEEIEERIEKHIRENEELKESLKILANQKSELENQKYNAIKNLIEMTVLSDEEIAQVQNVKIDIVKKIRQDLKDK